MKSWVREFKQKFNLVEYAKGLDPEWKQERDGISIHCPWHSDEDPSLWITEDKYHCWAGCGTGDNIDFLARYHNTKDIREAINKSKSESCVMERPTERKAKVYRLPDTKLLPMYSRTLFSNPRKIGYLMSRGLRVSTMRKYNLGYGRALSKKFKFPRYTIPIYSENHELVTIRYREDPVLEHNKKTKYVVYPSTRSYPFNLEILPYHDSVVYCGSQIDAILLNQYGVPSVASPGEGWFSEQWVELFNEKMVYVLFDNDEAGRLGVERFQDYLPDSIIINWPNSSPVGYDVNTAILDKEFGIDGVYSLLKRNGFPI